MPLPITRGALSARGFGLFSAPAALAADPYFNYVTMLLHGDGTNGAQNNTFLDSSTNNFTITRNGNTTQGSFSPYGSNWSNYFDGTGDYLSFTKQTTTSAFTCECWFYRGEDVSGYHIVFSGNNLSSVNADNVQLLVSNAGAVGLTLAGTGVIAQTGTAVIKNQWNHIAWVRSGTSCAIFVNGSRIATGTSSSALNVVSVGTYLSGYEPNGYVSNARINTTAVYDPSLTTCTVPTAPLTAITGTYLLTCQSNRFIDNSTNAFAITVNGTPSVQRFSPFSPTASYATATIGGSGYFDGSGDYLTVPDNAAWDFGTGNFTVECWIYPNSVSADQMLISQYDSTTGFSFQVDSGGTVVFYNGGTALLSGSSVITSAWQHCVAVRSGTTFSLYVNGTRIATGTNSTNITGSTQPLMIGNIPVAFSQPFLGYISDARVVKGTAIYDPSQSTITIPTAPLTAVSNTQLLTNFTNGGIFDNAMMNNLETVGNAQISTSVFKYGSGSLAFDGTGDYLTGYPAGNVNLDFGSGDFTVECWLYANSLSASDYIALMGFHDGSNTNSWGAYVRSNGVFFYGSAATLTGGGTVNTSTWYHFAASRSGSTIRVFLNGTQVGSNTVSGTYVAGGFLFRVGEDNAGSNPAFNGYIDDLRITKGYARYTTTFTPPTAAFPNN
jgi:hypothetical protein